MPEALNDRMQEGCECLVAIADLAWCGEQARAALVALLTTDRLDDQESMRLRLLRDIRTVFDERRAPGMATTALLEALFQVEESPWLTYYGRGLTDRDLSSLLRPYDVRPKSLRVKAKFLQDFDNKAVVKGYKRDDLHEAWERYL
jgi:hypothetical protein